MVGPNVEVGKIGCGNFGELRLVNGSSYIKRAGPYMLGTTVGNSPVHSIDNCLARKDGTDEFYVIKILRKLQDNSTDAQQGKILLHTEYTLLKLLEGEPGVVQQHGLYKDEAIDENGDKITRLCLVLDCYVLHDFSPEYSNVTNLQYYVVDVKRLSENEAVKIFVDVLKIIQRLHNLNIAHRDLKLGNIIMNKSTGDIKIANFCLGKQLVNENELLTDQRGSPAYISPDVIKGDPYLGKPSDMWAMGVIFYTMLFGQFPFYDPCPSELFRKIKACDYTFPDMVTISPETIKLIKGLLVLDPKARLTCDEVIEQVILNASRIEPPLQVVPDKKCPTEVEEDCEVKVADTKPARITFSRIKEEPKVLTYRDLKKIFALYSSKDCNMKKALKRL